VIGGREVLARRVCRCLMNVLPSLRGDMRGHPYGRRPDGDPVRRLEVSSERWGCSPGRCASQRTCSPTWRRWWRHRRRPSGRSG